jgi:hypothetical protein
MKLDRIAFRLFQRAYDAAAVAPGDAKAHKRFEKWARLVSRIIGLPIEGCHETDNTGRARWVRVTAGVVVAVLIANYGAGAWLNPSKPQNPAPSRAAVGELVVVVASTGSASSGYFWDTVTGKEFLGFPAVLRSPTIKST